jgi:UDP-3-O-[3-hydroxymyristoyl] glucosamine N-acyltransferase
MQFTLQELQSKVGGKLFGDAKLLISGVSDLDSAQPGEISFAQDIQRLKQAQRSLASALVVCLEFPDLPEKNLLRTDNPRYVFLNIMKLFERKPQLPPGIHSSAVIAEEVDLRSGVRIAEHAVIRRYAVIGQGTHIESGVHLGEGVKIGEDCWIGPNVVLRYGVQLGNRVSIHSNSVIGGDGFGYLWAEDRQQKIPQLGTVQIDDDVEIGCNVCIDRATFGCTRIRQGTKIDNLVQIGHNNDIGEHCIIISQVGLSGSVTLGKRVTLAGQVGVADHLNIGDGAIVGAASGVSKDIKPGEIVWGLPAQPRKKTLKELASLARLPSLIRQVKELTNRLTSLERRMMKED